MVACTGFTYYSEYNDGRKRDQRTTSFQTFNRSAAHPALFLLKLSFLLEVFHTWRDFINNGP
jgi:hypothetical protein